MINAKKTFQSGEIAACELILNDLHDILMNDAHNKYHQSFHGVKECVEKECARQSLDVKFSNHATTSTQQLIHLGCLNAPTVYEIAILLPSDDTIIQKHIKECDVLQ